MHSHAANFPLALVRLSTLLKNRGYQVTFIDAFNVHGNTQEERERVMHAGRIVRHAPLGGPVKGNGTRPVYLVGLTVEEMEEKLDSAPVPDEIFVSSAFTWTWETTHSTVAVLRRRFPKARITVGGIYPTLCPEKAAGAGADVHRGALGGVEGAWLDADLLAGMPMLDGIVLKTSTGCPHRCAYCAVHELEGRRVVLRDPADVLEEIGELGNRVGFEHVFFWESSLLVQVKRHFERILDGVAAGNRRYALHAPEGFQPSLVTPSLAAKMKASGFREPHLALETTDEALLKTWRRRCGIRDIDAAIASLCDAGYAINEISAILLIGHPEQTTGAILLDIARIHALGIKTSLLVYTPIPRTTDYLRYAERLGGRPLEDLDSYLFPMAHDGMTADELERIVELCDGRRLPLAGMPGGLTERRAVRQLRQLIAESPVPAGGNGR